LREGEVLEVFGRNGVCRGGRGDGENGREEFGDAEGFAVNEGGGEKRVSLEKETIDNRERNEPFWLREHSWVLERLSDVADDGFLDFLERRGPARSLFGRVALEQSERDDQLVHLLSKRKPNDAYLSISTELDGVQPLPATDEVLEDGFAFRERRDDLKLVDVVPVIFASNVESEVKN